MKKLILFSVALIVSFVITEYVSASNLPTSKQGTLVETVSSSEVLIHATGIGNWKKGDTKAKDMDNRLLTRAENDARKAAVYFVLFGGTDPMLQNDEAKRSFEKIQESFFELNNVKSFIAWEGQDVLKRTKREIKRKREYQLSVDKAFKINKELINSYLNQHGVLPTRAAVIDAVGMPFIMVVPSAVSGKSPIALLQSDPKLSHAAKVIESYLTARRYDVIVPEQQVAMQELTNAQQFVQGVEEDQSYQLALSVGSDVYITYDVSIEADKHSTKKASVNARAFETTTARLLGTETGYSSSSQSADMVLIEQAVNDAIDKVLSRIMAYWKEDLTRGVQYKIIVSISEDFSKDDSEDIAFAFGDLLKSVSKGGRYKENLITTQTMDFLVWCDPTDYGQTSQLYRQLRTDFPAKFPSGQLRQVNLNRKLVLLKIDAQ